MEKENILFGKEDERRRKRRKISRKRKIVADGRTGGRKLKALLEILADLKRTQIYKLLRIILLLLTLLVRFTDQAYSCMTIGSAKKRSLKIPTNLVGCIFV